MIGHTSQAGQTLVIFALVLAFCLVGMLALVVDLGTLFVAYNRVDDAALLAIQAGASAIDQGSFYTGSLRLDPEAAEQRCRDTLAAARLQGRCTADVRSITADVSQVVTLPVPLLGVRAPIHVSRTAQPAFGGSTAETTS
ncbi:MAG TPA: hypothetical protein VKF14_18365 [Candidatus Dormibacteraeota bacterium]|nr:hypothetical protein [Candidatus Dormibacteraeota bacterium]